jgi:ferritin-like metal-binding protein YciE
MGTNRTGTQMSPIDSEKMQRYSEAMGTDSPVTSADAPPAGMAAPGVATAGTVPADMGLSGDVGGRPAGTGTSDTLATGAAGGAAATGTAAPATAATGTAATGTAAADMAPSRMATTGMAPTGVAAGALPRAQDTAAAAMRGQYVDEAERIGSVPPPGTIKGAVSTMLDKLTGDRPEVLIDKLGERLAFERTGTRLYDAMLTKCQRLETAEVDPDMMRTLQRIRDEEAQHMTMVDSAIRSIGGDPTAMTPCADVAAVATMGVLQVVSDPRTTLPQCLNALLTAELTDNAGWELLIKLARASGHTEMATTFGKALAEEEQHMMIVKGWLQRAVVTEAS